MAIRGHQPLISSLGFLAKIGNVASSMCSVKASIHGPVHFDLF